MAELRWTDAHDGSPAAYAFDHRNRLVGQVAYYDVVGPSRRPGWVGYVHGHRVTGRCDTGVLARHLVGERATISRRSPDRA